MFQLYMLIIVMILPTIIMTIAYSSISIEVLQLTKSRTDMDRCHQFKTSSAFPTCCQFRSHSMQILEAASVEPQIKIDVPVGNASNGSSLNETAFHRRYSSFKRSFKRDKSIKRSRSMRNSVNGYQRQTYQTRESYSQRKSQNESLIKQNSANRSRERRNEAQVKKVGRRWCDNVELT